MWHSMVFLHYYSDWWVELVLLYKTFLYSFMHTFNTISQNSGFFLHLLSN